MDFSTVFAIFLGAVLVNNFVLQRFLGLCPYIGVSKDSSSAIGMGMAVIFVMTMASIATWPIYNYLLAPTVDNIWPRIFGGAPPNLIILRTICFILVIAALVQFVEMFLQKMVPALHRSLGIFLPLITTNCAVLGVAVLNIDRFFPGGKPVEYSYLQSILQGFFAGIGFTLAMILMSAIREQLELADVPKPLRGIPIAFITAGFMSMAFLGFVGLVK